MKKLLYCLVLSVLMVNCGGNKAEKESGKAQRADSIAQAAARQQAIDEALAQAEAEAEQARQDSIRQDSIAQEDKMRLKPSYFPYGDYEEKKLKNIGFKKTKDKFTPYDEEEPGFGCEEVSFTRTFNGRRIDIEYVGESCHVTTIRFYDNRDKEDFISALNKAGRKQDSDFTIRGNKIEMGGC